MGLDDLLSDLERPDWIRRPLSQLLPSEVGSIYVSCSAQDRVAKVYAVSPAGLFLCRMVKEATGASTSEDYKVKATVDWLPLSRVKGVSISAEVLPRPAEALRYYGVTVELDEPLGEQGQRTVHLPVDFGSDYAWKGNADESAEAHRVARDFTANLLRWMGPSRP